MTNLQPTDLSASHAVDWLPITDGELHKIAYVTLLSRSDGKRLCNLKFKQWHGHSQQGQQGEEKHDSRNGKLCGFNCLSFLAPDSQVCMVRIVLWSAQLSFLAADSQVPVVHFV